MGLGILVTICSLVLTAIDAGRRKEAWQLRQEEVFNLTKMAIQTRQDRLAINGVEVEVRRTSTEVQVFHEGKEVVRVVKN